MVTVARANRMRTYLSFMMRDERFRRFMDRAPDALGVIDRVGEIEAGNECMIQQAGN
jgi:hypothetical protein